MKKFWRHQIPLDAGFRLLPALRAETDGLELRLQPVQELEYNRHR